MQLVQCMSVNAVSVILASRTVVPFWGAATGERKLLPDNTVRLRSMLAATVSGLHPSHLIQAQLWADRSRLQVQRAMLAVQAGGVWEVHIEGE